MRRLPLRLPQDAANVRTLAPIAGDAQSTADAVEPLARQVTAMERFLGQYRPTIALSGDARLMYVMAQDPNADTSALYPTIYAKPLLNEPANFARIRTKAAQLQAKMSAFTVQHLPGQSMTSLQGHAVPLGFVPVLGCDANWNGKGWTVTSGKLNISQHIEGHADFELPATGFDARTGLLYLRLDVQFKDTDGPLVIHSAAVAFTEGDIATETTISYDPATATWTPGVIASPLAYLLAPTADHPAPVVLNFGTARGAVPTRHAFMLPFTLGGLQPQ